MTDHTHQVRAAVTRRNVLRLGAAAVPAAVLLSGGTSLAAAAPAAAKATAPQPPWAAADSAVADLSRVYFC